MHVQQDEPTHQPLIAHTPGWHAAVTVGILGWVLDAFDFFDVIFLLTEFAAKRANQQRPTVKKIPRTLWSHAGIFGYLLLVMTAMTVSPTHAGSLSSGLARNSAGNSSLRPDSHSAKTSS